MTIHEVNVATESAESSRHSNERASALRCIDSDTFKSLAQPNARRWLFGVATEWAVIACTIVVCVKYPSIWLWAIGVFIVGTRQHALGIMAHEGVHNIISRNRQINDTLANLLSAYPLMYSVQGYRTYHLQHHRWLETSKDPEQAALNLYPREWTFPMRGRRLAWILFRDMIGASAKPASDLVKYIWQVPGGVMPQVIRIACVHSAAVGAAILSGHLLVYLVLWIFPLFSVAIMCFRIRTVAEHSGIGAPQDRYRQKTVNTLGTTRTTVYGPIFRFLFGPHNMAYHVEHHLFPDVPVFNLRKLHETLMKNPTYASAAHVSVGHAALVAELTRVDADSVDFERIPDGR